MGQRIRLGGGATPSKPKRRRSGGIKLGRKLQLWEMAVLALGLVAVVWGGIQYYRWTHPPPVVFPTSADPTMDAGTDLIMQSSGSRER